MRDHMFAVDVGTGSARAGILHRDGTLVARATHPIIMAKPRENHAEHDSGDIWRAVCQAVRQAREQSGIPASSVAAIGFDATCSLVARDGQGAPVSVSTGGEDRFDTIVWLDHRAINEADFISRSGHRVLDFAGGSVSPEMQIPKLMWLKKHLPQSWQRAVYLFDLADFLTWKATGVTTRSRCTLAAKWNYLAHEAPGWQQDYLALAGLEDLPEKGGLSQPTLRPWQSIGTLSPQAAQELGLDTGCHVSAGMIDAYAGALGALGGCLSGDDPGRSAALVAGTSSCLVAFAREPLKGRSLWGPYHDITAPGYWLVEGGQSASGALLDHIVAMHPAGGVPEPSLHAKIIARVQQLRAVEGEAFAGRLHVLPDFHGNRSPLADPHAVGVISGLTLDLSFDSLCRLYWRTCVAIALGIRHVLDAMREAGYRPDNLHITGGHVHNPLLMELYADATGCRVVVPGSGDAVLLGTAMAAGVAGGVFADMSAAGAAMYRHGHIIEADPLRSAARADDYRCFLAMHRHRAELDSLAASPAI